MRACSEETAFRIISRLNSPDFWTPAGLRTVSRLDPRFDPAAHSGLMGGVWPGLTWWYAFGAQRYHPDFMVRALRSSFEHYGVDPQRYNTVPGQFGEWFDGESLANRGMRLSPWEPPRFLWAAVEGVCGLVLMPGAPRVNPLMPAGWNWVALRDVPYHGRIVFVFSRPRARERLSRLRDVHDRLRLAHRNLYRRCVRRRVDLYRRRYWDRPSARSESCTFGWQYRCRDHLRSRSNLPTKACCPSARRAAYTIASVAAGKRAESSSGTI